jgi:hypothetical protein
MTRLFWATRMQLTVNRLFSFEDIVQKYGGPQQVWERLRPYLPIWGHHDGNPIYLESQVDKFLRAVQRRWSVPSSTGDAAPPTEQPVMDEYLKIAEVSSRYLGGKMSKEWWYKQTRSGRLKFHKAGGSVLLKVADIVAFIEAMRPEDRPTSIDEASPEDTSPITPPPSKKSSKRRGAGDQRSGFRFFGQ